MFSVIAHIFKINKLLVPRDLSSNTDSNLVAYWSLSSQNHNGIPNLTESKQNWFYPMHVLVRSLSSLVVPQSTLVETRSYLQIFSFSNSLLINCCMCAIYVYSLPLKYFSNNFFLFSFLIPLRYPNSLHSIHSHNDITKIQFKSHLSNLNPSHWHMQNKAQPLRMHTWPLYLFVALSLITFYH